jgi:CO/xanthine dehydrogenase Mo-binding subunit
VIDGGAYVTLSPVVLSRGSIHGPGPYDWPHVRVRSRAVRTHDPPAGAFRGFGAPQAIFAIEAHMDEIAARLGMDPVALREKNLLREGAITATGQQLRESVGIEPCLSTVRRESGYDARRANCEAHNATSRDVARGVGLALFWHGGGFTGAGERTLAPRAALELHPSGTVEVLVANTEFGQGSLTALAQIAADACGLPLESVRYPLPDTSRVPNSGPTVASRTTMIVGRTVQQCGHALVEAVLRRLNAEREGEGVRLADGRRLSWPDAASRACEGQPIRIERVYEHPAHLQWDEHAYRGDAYAAYSWGAVVAAVSVDRATLEVTCDEVWAAIDIGTVINPREARGQVEGGLAQALGYALLERITYDAVGRVRENRLQTYVIPTSADIPPLHVTFVEVPYGNGPFGAKGLGELPMNGLGPALRNAVRHALGSAPTRIPMTPDTLLASVGQGASGPR